MYLRAQVRFKNETDANDLVVAFFKLFRPENSIAVENGEASIEIYFNYVPKEIVEVISKCKIITFYYGNDLDTFKENECEAINQTEQEAEKIETTTNCTAEKGENAETTNNDTAEEAEQTEVTTNHIEYKKAESGGGQRSV